MPETMRAGRRLWAARKLFLTLVALAATPPSVLTAYDPAAGDYSKEHPLDIRLVTYNTLGEFIATPSKDSAFNRVIAALIPDVIVLEEIDVSVSESEVASRLNTILPITPDSWQTHDGMDDGYTRVVIASRFPLTMTRTDTIPASSTRGVNIVLVDLPDAQYAGDIYLLGVHLKASSGSSNDAKRQRSADAIASWLGDARQANGHVALDADTPMIVLGDFNLVGPSLQPEATLLTGDIQDNATFGADVKGDWDVSDITDLEPADPFTGGINTYPSTSTSPTSRLDRFMFTDSVVTIDHSFVLNTLTMTTAARTAAGVQANDTTKNSTSDHLPIAMDIHFTSTPTCSEPSADFSRDCAVDATDFDVFEACMTGADVLYDPSALPELSPGCTLTPDAGSHIAADFDTDGDVDMDDFGVFQRCYSGPGQAADPDCTAQ